MPVVSCPKCPTKLKVPDGAKGNTKCPKCGAVFPVAPKPAFEVVEDEDPKKTASKPDEDEPDFEVVEDEDEEPKKKKSADDDDDDDDDFDDSKKKKKKKSESGEKTKVVFVVIDGDDDDDDDRPRKKKRRRGGGSGGDGSSRAAYGNGKVGSMLLSISCWLNLGAYGLLALYILIAWLLFTVAVNSTPSTRSGGGSTRGAEPSGDSDISAADVMDFIAMLPGLVGAGGWIVGLVGCGFAIAGPARARGMAITATVFAAIHLVLLLIVFTELQDGMGRTRALPGVGKLAWVAVASVLPMENTFLPIISHKELRPALEQSSYIIALLAGICEALRLIFILQSLSATADAAGDGFAADKASGSARIAYIILGVMPFVVFVLGFLVGAVKGTGAFHLIFLMALLMYGAYAFMMLGPALAARDTKDACDRRS